VSNVVSLIKEWTYVYIVVFECWASGKILGPQWEEIARDWRKLHIRVVHDTYSPPNIIRVIYSRRMRWMSYMGCVG